MDDHMAEPSPELLRRYEKLKEYIGTLGSAAVAFSAGVDSTFLLKASEEALGKDRIIAVTASISSLPERERDEAAQYCASLGIRHFVTEVNELEIPGFRENPKNRCYLCKRALFTKMLEISTAEGMQSLLEGSNLDDDGDYRPGMQAIRELQVRSPLRSVGFTKEDIRLLSRHLNLPTWKKQSFSCLSTRVPYGEPITPEKLQMIDRAEQFLFELGFRVFRVRIHGTIARIELLPEDFTAFMENGIREKVSEAFRTFGFSYVTLDLMGYRTGSMNETLSGKELSEGQHIRPVE